MIDLDNLARLRAASEKVNPTPWTVLADGGPPDDLRFAAYIDDDDENCVVQPGVRLDSAKLIVAVVNALPLLLADHARLVAEVARLRGLLATPHDPEPTYHVLASGAERVIFTLCGEEYEVYADRAIALGAALIRAAIRKEAAGE